MPDKTVVSIIIPVYNSGLYLKETIECALRQSWENKEIIVVNDGSTDDSLDIASSFTGDVVKVFTQARKGAGSARNLGIVNSSGAYLQFLDADDLLSDDKVKRQVHDLENQPGKLAVCSTVHFPDGQDHTLYSPAVYEEQFLKNTADSVEFLVKLWGGYDQSGSMIQPNAWLVPADVIKKAGLWNEQLSLDDDGEFFCRVILNSAGIIRTENVFNYYRKHLHYLNLSGKKTFVDLNSLLTSALSKKKELLSRTGSAAAQQAIYRQLYDVILLSYPSFPEIYKRAEKELPENAAPYKPRPGGPIMNLFAGVFGVKAALYIRYLLNRPKL